MSLGIDVAPFFYIIKYQAKFVKKYRFGKIKQYSNLI